MCGTFRPLMIVAPMGPQAAECLSPELVLILAPEEAAAVRRSLPDPGRFSTAVAIRPAARRSSSTLQRAVGSTALYAGVLAVTVTPLALMLKAVPSGHRGTAPEATLRVDHNLRAQRNHPH
jgi:hypothetical protein